MKIRTYAVAVLAAGTLVLTGCGNNVAGTAQGASNAITAGSTAPSGGTDTPTDETTTDETTTDDTTTADETTTDGTTDEQTTSEDTTTDEETTSEDTTSDDTTTDEPTTRKAGGIDMEGCQALGALVQDWSTNVVQKIMKGGVTQADVNKVFSAEAMAKIPDSVKSDVEDLKAFSEKLVGKTTADLAPLAHELSDWGTRLPDLAKKACS